MTKFKRAVDAFEEEYGVQGLLMRDFGSRAYNLASATSDHDAILVFRQDPSNWVKVGCSTEHFQRQWEDIDIQGWSLKKFASLIADSNPTAMEFLNSPITYYVYDSQMETVFDELRDYANRNFNPIGLYYHYRSLAQQNYSKYVQKNINFEAYKGEDERYKVLEEGVDAGLREYWIVDTSGSSHYDEDEKKFYKDLDDIQKGTLDQTVKRNLFAGRAVAMAKYIRLQKEMPPMDLQYFLEECPQDAGLNPEEKETLDYLVAMKTGGRGSEEIGSEIEELVESELAYEPSNEELNVRGIERERVNRFVEECLS